jgi:ABC-2 type transport system ATP-binding protein
MSVNIQNLSKIYGQQRAVDNISFQVQAGEVLGFLGPNGAGKSTTMKITTCYLPPSSGTVEVCGYDVVKDPIEVRRRVGYLPEHNPLYLEMYVHEYLRFIGSLHGMSGNRLTERVKEMVALTGLTREQNKKIGALSKGYRQRVGLAQAMIHDPAVLILDEPTTGLDPNQLVEIRNLIREIGRQKTVIFSTHIMQEVQAICDRVIIVNQGKIVADSPVAALAGGNTSTRTIVAEFDAPVSAEMLAVLPGVTEVRAAGTNRYEVVTDAAQDARPAIFRLAAEQNLGLIGLQQQESSLESVFQQLTQPTNLKE